MNQTQKLSLIQELDLSIETVESALAIIQKNKLEKTPYFLIFLLLSTGIERLCKLIIQMRRISDGQALLSSQELKNNKKYGHNLTSLKQHISAACYLNDSLPPALKEDKEFLESDTILNELFKHLSEFALSDRYVYMNMISENKATQTSISSHWEQLSSKIITRKEMVEMQSNEISKRISNSLIITIEKLLRALCRTITLGGMNKDSNSFGVLLYKFLFIKDSELGTQNYEL